MSHIVLILSVSVLPLLLLSLVACVQGNVRSAVFSEFTDPSQTAAFSPGVRSGHFSNRNAMSVAYAAYTPALYFDEDGKFKVPTLRNIALSAPYMHHDVFTTLTEAVDFYNTRDVKKWLPVEVAENVNKEELGNLKLTSQEVGDIIVFMKTLSDGYSP
ncbi:hypothetical protein [Kaarinaea lacus]